MCRPLVAAFDLSSVTIDLPLWGVCSTIDKILCLFSNALCSFSIVFILWNTTTFSSIRFYCTHLITISRIILFLSSWSWNLRWLCSHLASYAIVVAQNFPRAQHPSTSSMIRMISMMFRMLLPWDLRLKSPNSVICFFILWAASLPLLVWASVKGFSLGATSWPLCTWVRRSVGEASGSKAVGKLSRTR